MMDSYWYAPVTRRHTSISQQAVEPASIRIMKDVVPCRGAVPCWQCEVLFCDDGSSLASIQQLVEQHAALQARKQHLQAMLDSTAKVCAGDIHPSRTDVLVRLIHRPTSLNSCSQQEVSSGNIHIRALLCTYSSINPCLALPVQGAFDDSTTSNVKGTHSIVLLIKRVGPMAQFDRKQITTLGFIENRSGFQFRSVTMSFLLNLAAMLLA